MPYRSQRRKAKAAPAPSAGAVADMVRQFADPYAFARELVQNAIDAGASAIEVRVDRGPDGVARFAVSDDGEGMDRPTIEGPLLTLFLSGKEGQAGKIGKYGVGFVSVLAIAPDEVLVETWREGSSLVVRLRPDHSFELEVGPERPKSGTVVTLVKHLEADAYAEHAAQVRVALRRWCRHAAVPIHLTVTSAQRPLIADSPRERVNDVLAVPAVLAVDEAEGEERCVVGPSAGWDLRGAQPGEWGEIELGESFAGFYNRGLTLFETAQPLAPELRGLRFKVMSPALQHTLSRDNVLRDEAFARVLRQVRELATGRLRAELAAQLARAARDVALVWASLEAAEVGATKPAEPRAAPGPADAAAATRSYVGLLAAACARPLALEPGKLCLPLTEPIADEWTTSLGELVRRASRGERPLLAERADELTAALARAGRPVVRLVDEALRSRMAWSADPGGEPVLACDEYVLVRPIPEARLTEPDHVLCELTGRMLRAAGAKLGSVDLATTAGAAVKSGAIAVSAEQRVDPADDAPPAFVCTRAETAGFWRRLGAARDLLLPVGHEAVRRARALAQWDALTAGALLARALLVAELGALSKSVSDRLVEAATKELA
ncbi:MAG: ATP-binding protein [Deltaproteobacteria bacterium]|nr:ATP-binding protein [Deltaproteobacteria bacterium]